VYDCVLEGLNLVAKQAALPLLDHLLTWRREALVRATRAGGEVMVLRKRVRLPPKPQKCFIFKQRGEVMVLRKWVRLSSALQ